MRLAFIAAVLGALLPVHATAGQEIGEWGPDAEMCDISRLVFTEDGLHQSRMLQDGSWQTLASAPYRRDGEVLTIENPGVTEQLRVLDESADRLVLQNTNPEQQRKTGRDQVELVRCP